MTERSISEVRKLFHTTNAARRGQRLPECNRIERMQMDAVLQTPLRLLVVVPALLSMCFAFRADAQEADASSAQLEALRATLAEGIGKQDWQLIERSLNGFKAAGIRGAALQALLKEASHEVALSMLWPQKRAKLKAWTLAVRALQGEDDARRRLREQAQCPAIGPETFDPRKKDDYADRIHLAVESLLCLAHLKDEGAEAIARSWLLAPSPAAPGPKADPVARDAYRVMKTEQEVRLRAVADCYVALQPAQGLQRIAGILDDTSIGLVSRSVLFAKWLDAHSKGVDIPVAARKTVQEKLHALVGELTDRTPKRVLFNLLGQFGRLGLDRESIQALATARDRLENPELKRDMDLYVKHLGGMLKSRSLPRKAGKPAARGSVEPTE